MKVTMWPKAPALQHPWPHKEDVHLFKAPFLPPMGASSGALEYRLSKRASCHTPSLAISRLLSKRAAPALLWPVSAEPCNRAQGSQEGWQAL